jgi:hypothetical protein
MYQRERERGKFEKGGKQKDTARETHLVGINVGISMKIEFSGQIIL